ncbi:MAG TPA: UDP-glucose/GDP-mannose dehydrogenase family protein [Terriglobales bacterium]|nr:UDP-glucose/GDP-mannose dehydrogenase family protein [Terriglobales bacterium]
MKISVIGAGYVGLTTSACLAELGHQVFCSENDPQKLGKLQNGELPFFEPHLEELFGKSRKDGRLRFGSTEEAIDWGQCIFICVGTPPLDNGDADLSAIERVARTIAKQATGYRLVIEKSTVPVQTAIQLRRHLASHKNNRLEYDVASNPEFLREGSAVENFFHPDRIVVGAESPRAREMMREIYQPILDAKFVCPVHKSCKLRTDVPFLVTDTNSAELIKHASNSFLAMKISYINAVSDLCEAAGADIAKVAEGIGLDPRIGSSFLNPGIGFGGFCFPKDLQAFVRIAEKFGCDFAVLKEVERINRRRIDLMVEKIKKELWVLRGKKIGIWGLSFKPDTDDVRFAPALAIIRQLMAEGADIHAFDPQAIDNARKEIPEITYCADAYEAATGADVVVLLTEWAEFRQLDWAKVAKVMERPMIIDGRNALSADQIATHGLEYVGVGGVRRTANAANSAPSMALANSITGT